MNERYFFASLAIWFLLITLLGFSNSFYFTASEIKLRYYVIIHGIIFTCWILLFLTQTVLISSKRYKWHFKFGWFGFLLSFVIFFSGVYTSFTKKPMYLNEVGNNLSYIITFLLFVLIGIKYRSTPHIHKRCLVFATMMLTSAAVARIKFFGIDFGNDNFAYYVVFFFPILLLLAYDFGTIKKKLQIDVLGLILIFLMIFGTNLIWETKVWSVIVYEIMALLK